MAENPPASVYYGAWPPESEKHPGMAFMHKYTDWFDTKPYEGQVDTSEWHTDDFTYVKSDNTVVKGADKAFAALAETYGPLTKYTHEPYFAIATDTDYGYQMIGQAYLFANLPGQAAQDEPAKVNDKDNKQWDIVIPAGFRFEYKKDSSSKHGEVKLQKTEIMSDSAPILMRLAKRGVIQLG